MSHAAERVARDSYGRLVAILAARSGDIAAAEDALAEAFLSALESWPTAGVPESPEAWLVTAARRRLLDTSRKSGVRERARPAIEAALDELASATNASNADAHIPDERLRLLFVCTHPALGTDTQVPLMLQTVLGLDAARIARAMRVAPKTMGQRLWRSKVKIAESGIPFTVPAREELPERLDSVLEAIYGAYGTAWEDVIGEDPLLVDLRAEAVYLCRLLRELLPLEAEVAGLLSLVLFAEARRGARRSDGGALVPLARQDTSLWSMTLIHEAETNLSHAFRLRHIGPFQLEAAIQSAHVFGVRAGRVDYESIVSLYEGLLVLAPSMGAAVGYAAALLEARGAAAALAALDAPPFEIDETYQPLWVVRAHALFGLGRDDEAGAALARAIALTEDPAVRTHLEAMASARSR